MSRYLVVAHRTLGGPHLLGHLQRLREEDASCQFHVIVPKYHSKELLWAEGTTEQIAQQQLDEMLERMSAAGLDATGEVGDGNPMNAISNSLSDLEVGSFDGIVLSTLPRAISRWWRSDVPRRVEQQFPTMQLTHLVAEDVAAG